LVNLVADRTVVTELIQSDATAQRLYEEAVRMLDNPAVYEDMKRSLRQVKAALGGPGASTRAAEVVLAACRT
jgi:lipid-A-disaccharide synthase